MSAETDATPNVVANGDAGAASPKKEASDGCANAQAILRLWAACLTCHSPNAQASNANGRAEKVHKGHGQRGEDSPRAFR